MSSRPQFNPHPVLNSVTGQHMSSNLTGLPTIIQKLSMMSYSFSWVTVTLPAAKSFIAANVSVADNTITIASNGFYTGLKVALTGTGLPTGLSATNYYIVLVDQNTIKLATSQANAIAGTVVDITGQGTTSDALLTPGAAASLSGSVSVQVSNDYSLNQNGSVNNAGTWNTMTVSSGGLAVTVVPVSGATGNGFIDIDATAGYAMRVIYTATAGDGTLSAIVNGKVA